MSNPNYTIKHIAEIISADYFAEKSASVITSLVIDSRSVTDPEGSLFFALSGQRDGHDFLTDAYKSGIRSFVIAKKKYLDLFHDANFLLVEDVLKALQQLAKYNRSLYDIPVIAITGSNGKTIVKEWLYQLLAADFNIVRSPKSFNSQIGVPLSVWQMEVNHTLGIFEAGISKKNEMDTAADVIRRFYFCKR
jgi:UDP-N-acetylmuramyl pentapeptide synthase